MKSLRTNLFVFLFAMLFLASSCVKNEVSEEVKNLREAQLTMVNAKIEYQNAQNALAATENLLRQADLKTKELQNSYVEAMNAINLAERRKQSEVILAGYTAQLKQQEAALKNAEYQLFQATEALEKAIAEAGLVDAQGYLNMYNDAMGMVFGYTGEKLQKQAEIDRAKLLLNPSSNLDWDFIKGLLETELAMYKAELASLTDAKASLVAVLGDPAVAAKELADAKAELATLKVAAQDAEKAAGLANVARTDAQNTYDNAWNLISKYDGMTWDIDQTEINISQATKDIKYYQDRLERYMAQFKTANDKAIELRKVADSYYDSYLAAKAISDAKYKTYQEKQMVYNVAVNNYNANPTAANQLAMEVALTARDTAYDDYSKAWATTSNADQNYYTANNSASAVENEASSLQDSINQYESYIRDAQARLLQYQGDLAKYKEQQAAWASDYAAAKTNLPKYETELLKAETLQNDAWSLYNNVQGLVNAYSGVVYTLENWGSNKKQLEQEIDNLTMAIVQAEASINRKENEIAQNAINKAYYQAAITKLEAELANLTTKITEQQAIADKYKSLLDGALAGN